MDTVSSSLQVPQPGPSRQAVARPVSVQPASSAATSPPSSRKRASHTVVTSQPQQDEQPVYRDIYSHPAALEYAAAHPRRMIPKFGPYLLLQTLGEGEFGKVKLGLHMEYGEEVAVKLIRRGNIDSSVRMSKIEREIQVLKSLKHPNIVRLYDVIETDKYIGIILEYASGGELFDHILAHRYLREKDACKLFSQLISGVWYIHQKKIVHRDLKLENLLLDRHRNVIITDFGFANRFEHRADDLMQTSCGSPCYAAPELVISDGLYVGSAVDIWSCGVILYAMLAGYLPFDDDPANPDGDNINLLYKYIVTTPLSFPDYISAEARDLLSIMLVPDPAHRADLPTIMRHKWLQPYAHLFTRNIEDFERAAVEQHHQKRLAYQRQMKQSSEDSSSKVSRSHSARTETYAGTPSAPSTTSRSRGHKDPYQQAQPEYLYETSAEQSVYSTSPAPSSSRRGFNSTIVLPTSSPMVDDDPFAQSPSQDTVAPAIPSPVDNATQGGEPGSHKRDEIADKKASAHTHTVAPVKSSPDNKRPKGGFRHTIQVEYGESEAKEPPQKGANRAADISPIGPASPIKERERPARRPSVDATKSAEKAVPVPSAPTSTQRQRSGTVTSKRSIAPPSATPSSPPVAIEVTGPPVSPIVSKEEKLQSTFDKADSTSSKQSRHRKGLSIDKIGISKLFGAGAEQTNGTLARAPSQSKSKSTPSRTPSTDAVMATGKSETQRRPSTLQTPVSPPAPSDSASNVALLSPETPNKKSRRATLTVMVEPFSRSIKQRTAKGRGALETPVKEKAPAVEKAAETAPPIVPPKTPMPAVPKEIVTPATPVSKTSRPEFSAVPSKGERLAVPASTAKASKVMQWFWSKNKGRVTDDEADRGLEIETVQRAQAGAATPSSEYASAHPQRSPSTGTHTGESIVNRVRQIGSQGAKKQRGYADIRTHHGAVDQTTVTTRPPPEVMKHVKRVLEDMGMEIYIESDYKYRCVRPKKRKMVNGVGLGLREGSNGGLTAFTMVGTAASNGVDKRGLPQPPQSHTSFGSTGGMLRGLLMRRQSSQVSTSSQNQNGASQSADGETSPDAVLAAAVPGGPSDAPVAIESVYGDASQDHGDEIRFYVELTRIDRLDDTYSLDIRRLKGNLRSYKFVYDTVRQRADLQNAL
ncbi:Pkinase-domain-containing protein [Wolfiporia cocos MD-104 SS10]|uniref:non-specific serine/threonine protein kinase n=1 Tax=Wolfiporia cocos (strain MD-104) TaxID=742152 RepID=A0A2H3JL93_WOLCO|nr:Pkinase-domain-containing protein [Wolfiporia cocos MD-104 SS10]